MKAAEAGVEATKDMIATKGRALMTTEMVMEQFEDVTIILFDAPIVEGAIAAAVTASVGMDLDTVLGEAHQAVVLPKL